MKAVGSTGKLGLAVLGVFAVVLFAACQGGPPKISISNTSAKMSPAIRGEAMVSMSIRNEGGPDVLKGVRTDIPGAKVLFHVMQGERMATMDTVPVPAKGTLEFQMGGSHVMIEDMPKTMKRGSQFNLTLVFEKSGEKVLPLTLEGAATMQMDHHHHM